MSKPKKYIEVPTSYSCAGTGRTSSSVLEKVSEDQVCLDHGQIEVLSEECCNKKVIELSRGTKSHEHASIARSEFSPVGVIFQSRHEFSKHM